METSANTEYKLCIIDCNGSGTTITMTFNTTVYVIVEVTAMIE